MNTASSCFGFMCFCMEGKCALTLSMTMTCVMQCTSTLSSHKHEPSDNADPQIELTSLTTVVRSSVERW